jgi:predicted nuclease of restriction endonuclease-like (RecB) superfamily
MSKSDIIITEYNEWLISLKQQIRTAQQRAALAVNHELVLLYWHIGDSILSHKKQHGWGAKVIRRISQDLQTEFPEIKGFSVRNLDYMCHFANSWTRDEITQAPLAQLPWYHLITLQSKIATKQERLQYAELTVQHGWSRNVLVHHIEQGTARRIGAAQNNFALTLTQPQSDLARESLKDPYKLEFLDLSADVRERELERALVSRLSDFLLELGTGFAFVGKQVHIEVGGEDFYIDLLFYHIKLHCYVVIELKTTDFKPEHLGQLSFYITAVDAQMRSPQDAPTIGLLLCKNKNRVVAEYALRDANRPIGISKYELTSALSQEWRSSLPSVEDIERELSRNQ